MATTPGPTTAPTPTTAPATPQPPQIVRFRRESFTTGTRKLVDCTDPAFDNTIELEWELRAATGAELSIDGGGLYASYDGTTVAVTVPFSCGEASHTYKLTTTGGTGKPASMTRTIGRATPKILSWSLDADPACSGDTGTTPVTLSWEIAYATGVELVIDGAVYAIYPGKSEGNVPAGSFDCTKPEQTYTVTTTGGYGDAAQDSRVFSAH